MTKLFSFLAAMTLALACVAPAAAQTAATGQTELHISISARQITFTPLRAYEQLRLEVFNNVGELLYDSGTIAEANLNWNLKNANGAALTPGLYAYTLSIKAPGVAAPRRHQGHFIIEKGNDQIWLTAKGDDGVSAEVLSGELTIARNPAGTTAGTGYIASGRTLGERAGLQRDAQGRTVADKNNGVTREGNQFPLNISGSGTTNRMTKWLDGPSGVVGDSVIHETAAGDLGIGTAFPGGVLDVVRNSPNPLIGRFWNTGTGPAQLRFVGGTGATSQFLITDTAEWLTSIAVSNSIGMQLRVRGVGTPNNEAELSNSARLTLLRNGNVGIGTTAPSEKLEVAGKLKLTGAGNGVVFPDATEQTTRAFQWQVVAGATQQALSNTGYVLTNASQVTITLPAAPAVGDTVRVSGVGAGGWKIAQNAGQSVIGTKLGSFGANWTPRESNRQWRSVASSADGSKLVAVVSAGQIYTSTDSGVSWTPRESSRHWTSVASSADGSKLVAVAQNEQIYTSTDSGVNWTPRESSRSWWSVTSSADGSKLVAVVIGGQIYTSTDSGLTWAPRESNRVWHSVTSSADGSKLVAVVSGGQIYTSTDSGVSWTPRTEGSRNWYSVASSADGSKLVAVVASNQVYISTDSGVNWTSRESNRNWFSVASSTDGSKLVAVVNGDQIYISTDSGASWTPREGSREWRSVASSADGSKLVAVAFNGQIYTSTGNTTVGTAGFLSGGPFSAIELQYIGNGQFIPLSYVGAITNN